MNSVSQDLGISQRSVFKILHYSFKAYQIHLVSELSEDIYDCRVEICKLIIANIDNNTFELNNIVSLNKASLC